MFAFRCFSVSRVAFAPVRSYVILGIHDQEHSKSSFRSDQRWEISRLYKTPAPKPPIPRKETKEYQHFLSLMKKSGLLESSNLEPDNLAGLPQEKENKPIPVKTKPVPSKHVAVITRWKEMKCRGEDMDENGILESFVSVGIIKQADVAKRMYDDICKGDIPQSKKLQEQILISLVQCELLSVAIHFLDRLIASNEEVTTSMWNTVMKRVLESKNYAQVIDLWDKLIHSGGTPDYATTTFALQAASVLKKSTIPRRLYQDIIKTDISHLEKSHKQVVEVFFLCEDTSIGEQLAMWDQIMASGDKPDAFTAHASLIAANLLFDFKLKTRICKEILGAKMAVTIPLGKEIRDSLFHYGDIAGGLGLFLKYISSSTDSDNTRMWNIGITKLSKTGKHSQAVALWDFMISNKLKPDKNTVTATLCAIEHVTDEKAVTKLCSSIIAQNLPPDRKINGKLLNILWKQGDPETALSFFGTLKADKNIDTMMWNNTIQGLVACENGKEAIALFKEMVASDYTVNLFTISAVLTACNDTSNTSLAVKLVDTIESKFKIKRKAVHVRTLLQILRRAGKPTFKYSKKYEYLLPNKNE